MRLIPKFNAIQLSRREKMMVIAGSLVISIVAADRMVLSPWFKYSKKLEKSIAELSDTVRVQEMLLSRRASVQSDLERHKNYIHAGHSPEMEMADFLREIEELGQNSNVSLPEIKPLTSNPGDYFVEFGLEVRFEAELLDWMKFIYLVESSNSLFVIDKASVGRSEADSQILKGFMHIRKLVLTDKSLSAMGK